MALTHVGKMCYNKRQKERRNPQKMNIRGRVWRENFQKQRAKMLNELSGIIDPSRQKEKGGRIQDGRHRDWGLRLSTTGWHHSVSSRCAAAVAKK